MADGSVVAAVSDSEPGQDDTSANRFRSFLKSRNGIFTIVASSISTCLIAAAIWNAYQPFIETASGWTWYGAAWVLVLFPLLLLFLDSPDNMASGPKLHLPLITLALLAALAVASIWFKDELWTSFHTKSAVLSATWWADISPLAAYFLVFAAAFVARTWNAALHARYAHAQMRDREAAAKSASLTGGVEEQLLEKEIAAHRREQGDAEALSALIATATVIAVIALAYFAGTWGEDTRLNPNVGLVIACVVIAIFSVVVFLDWIAEFPVVRACSGALNGLSHQFAWLAHFYNFIDMLLVRIGAQVAGAGHFSMAGRYFVMAGTLIALVIISWWLPDPLGFVPICVGFALALSVSRLWAWVEEDRNMVSITQFNPNAPKKIGFREDFRDEAMLAIVFVLLLIPIALKQADASQMFGGPLFRGAQHETIAPWLTFFGLELAKALPIVDWADIYLRSENLNSLAPAGVLGKHATFVARSMVDLLLVASLLQALAITSRNRQQKALYAARQIDRLDEFVERRELEKTLRRPDALWFRRGVDFRHYNQDRLRELHSNTRSLRQKRFIETIFEQAGYAVGFAIGVLEKLSERRAPAEELEKTLATVRAEHFAKVNLIDAMDFEGVMDNLRATEGLKDFKLAVIDFAMEVGTPAEISQFLEQLVFGPRRDHHKYTRSHAARGLTSVAPRIADCDAVLGLIEKLESAPADTFGAQVFVPRALKEALLKRSKEICPPRAS